MKFKGWVHRVGRFKWYGVSLLLLVFSFNAHALKNSYPAYQAENSFNVYMTGEGIADGESFPMMCNGSMIAPDLMITAAHCLAGSMKHIDSIVVNAGRYITRTGKFGPYTMYYSSLDKVKVKNFFFPSAIDKKIRAGLLTKEASIPISDDIALVVLERPFDESKVKMNYVEIASLEEHDEVLRNQDKYSYIVVSTNVGAEVRTSDSKRYAHFHDVSINRILNKAYRTPMWSSDNISQVQPGDSGAPLLVNINGNWKLFAITRGFMLNALSGIINSAIASKDAPHIEITPERSIFNPIANKMCPLLLQARRHCHQF